MYMYTESGIAVAYTRSEHLDLIDTFEFVHEYKNAASSREIFSCKAEGTLPDAVGLCNGNSIFLADC
jgi:hypothetical protein